MTGSATNKVEPESFDTRIKQAEARKAEADARAAEAAANQAEADARAAEAAADQAEAEAEVGGLSKLAEDLSAVERGTLTTTGDQPVAFNALANRALNRAAAEAAGRLSELDAKTLALRLFITTDQDLATADAPHTQVIRQLKALSDQAEALVAEIDATPGPSEFSAAAAALGAVPAIIGALSPNRTISAFAGAVDDLNAAIATMGALSELNPRPSIILDDFRTVPTGTSVTTQFDDLQRWRQKLAELRIRIGDPPKVGSESEAAKLDALIPEIDKYTAYVVAPIGEGKRSPLAQASLHATLRGHCTHAVLVKGAGTSSFQVTGDMPFCLKDDISVVAHASIAFVAINLTSDEVVKSGIVTRDAQMSGKVGTTIKDHTESGESPWATTAQIEAIKADLETMKTALEEATKAGLEATKAEVEK